MTSNSFVGTGQPFPTWGETSQPWDRIVEYYRRLERENPEFVDIADLSDRLARSRFPSAGLRALTSMHDLVLGPSASVLDNPHLVVKPDFAHRQFTLIFRDGSPTPWTRTVPVSEGYSTLVRVMTKRVRWYREVGDALA